MLTDEDKQWFRGEIRETETNLRTEIQSAIRETETNLRTEIQSAIRETETNLRTEIQSAIHETETKLRLEIQSSKDEMIHSARDMQTEVIRYIANLAEPFNVRMRHLEANAGNLETAERLRLAALEERLLRIERRVLGEDAKA